MKRRRPLQVILSPSATMYSFGLAWQPDATGPGVQIPDVLSNSIDDVNDWVGFLKGHLRTRARNTDRLLFPHVSANDSERKLRLSR